MVVSRSIPGGHDGRVKFEAQVGKYGRKVLSETETEWAKAGSNDSSIHGWKQGWLGWLAAWLGLGEPPRGHGGEAHVFGIGCPEQMEDAMLEATMGRSTAGNLDVMADG
eukprot:scaffold13143_cov27-Cyclotella_meneghiniana.AAC.2